MNYIKLNDIHKEMTFTMELWKTVLELEDFVRNHYIKLAEREIYDLHNEEPDF
jgi:uncharacterized protein (DUF608 family)